MAVILFLIEVGFEESGDRGKKGWKTKSVFLAGVAALVCEGHMLSLLW